MTPTDCKYLDAHLLGELADGDAEAFESHLLGCAACRDAVDEQHWIDGLLTSPIGKQLESPSTILASTGITAHRRRQKRLTIAYGLAAAAVVLIAVGWILQRDVRAPGRPTEVAAIDREVVPAVFIGGDDLIVVPVASQDPSVTIVRLYPVYRPEADAIESSAAPTTNEIFWSDDTSGG